MTNAEFLKEWYHTKGVGQDFAAGAAAYTSGTSDAVVAGELTFSRSDYETLVQFMCRDFKPTEIELAHVISVGSEISAVVYIKGRRLSDESAASLTVHVYRKIEDGRYVAAHSSPDHMAFYAQMGQLPDDLMASLMMGGIYMD